MEEFMPLPADFVRSIRDDDRFIVAYPRSGMTWIRTILGDLVNQSLGLDPQPMYESSLIGERRVSLARCLAFDQVSVDAYHEVPRSHLRCDRTCVPAIFKTHNLHQIAQRADHKIVYLFRRPSSSLFSYFHMLRSDRQEGVNGVSLDDFCLARLNDWTNHVQSALQFQRTHPRRIRFIEYCDRQAFDRNQLLNAISFLGVSGAQTYIDRAMANFESFIRRMNAERSMKRGGHEDPRQHFSGRTAATIHQQTNRSYRKAVRAANGLGDPTRLSAWFAWLRPWAKAA